jgi:hypothetical protein
LSVRLKLVAPNAAANVSVSKMRFIIFASSEAVALS